jgi:branched-chain amino acid transport system permease protein
MSPDTLINGALLGGLYTIIALGLSLAFGVMRMVNLAHGALVVGGAYLSYLATQHLGLDPLVSLVLVCPAMFAVGYALQRSLLSGLLLRGSDAVLVATFGLMLLAQSVYTLAFTGNPRSLEASYASSGADVLGVHVRVVDLLATGLAVALVVMVELTLRQTRFGTAVRAAAMDPVTSASVGIDVRHVYAITFGVAAAAAGVAGVVLGTSLSFTPTSGLEYLTIGFTVVVLGGLGSVTGTLIAGVVIGMTQAAGGSAFGPEYQNLTVYLVFLALIAVRPQGLFGRVAA